MNYFKFIFLFLIAFLCSNLQSIYGQNSLKVMYEASQEIDLDEISIMGIKASNSNLADVILEAQQAKYPYELVLNKETSSFLPLERINNSQTSENIIVVMNPAGKHLYKNIKENYFVEEVSFLNRQFRIKDSLPNYEWKLEKDTKEILQYEVRKAVSVVDTAKIITAWYAPKLAFKDGPKNFWGLPGLILEVEISSTKAKDITRIKVVEMIELDDKNKTFNISQPKKGKFLSREEFRTLMDDYQTKEMEFFGQGVDVD